MKNLMHQNKEFKGQSGTLTITSTGVVIKRGKLGMLLAGGTLKGEKTIPFKSIVAVQLKKAGMMTGYIQLTLAGGSEAKGGLLQSMSDENSISFQNRANAAFEEAKQLIEERINSSGTPMQSGADELEKLAGLKDKGIITAEEFAAKKKQLLGL
jgi:hypothetical protein